MPEPRNGDLDRQWEDVGAKEQSAYLNQTPESYSDFRQSEAKAQAEQREEDYNKAFATPED